ncbi:unnamed protein product [Allacma fusca]|uniref:Uncharacterized protein n=1 Tax=Allacma fusca TaxID=39272 RepID=A0A8J2JGW1_9HEXA|nr:unnamed protein product [Allacma fusca]
MLKHKDQVKTKSLKREENNFKCQIVNMSSPNLTIHLKRVTGYHSSSKLLFLMIPWLFLFLSSSFLTGANGAEEDCPWYGNARVPAIIKSNCLCARNRTSHNQLSVQCHEIDGQQLVSILIGNRAGLKDPIELLYLNGSQVTDSNGQIPARLFREIKLVSLQLSGCSVKSIHPEAFRGQENYLKHLSLAQNQLIEVPSTSLELLTHLVLLDLSYNKITKIPQSAFETLTKLSTIKLNDNNLELDTHCFKGLENSLRNLNLKGTRISMIPEAISNLSSLAFLDLAQNRLRDLEPLPFLRLDSLTVLNLERNLLQSLPESVFTGVNDTLSSLSLLNNLITHFPKEALHSLKELRNKVAKIISNFKFLVSTQHPFRIEISSKAELLSCRFVYCCFFLACGGVLDLGFNLLTEIPSDAFSGLSSLTLLALDGNPLATLPLTSFTPLNSTLRGLSLGGRFLSCDCRIKWVHDWIQEYDLQVTSRERNPQFCGSPPALRQSNFYQLQTEDFKCEKTEPSTSPQPDIESSDDAPTNSNPKPFAARNDNIGKIRQNIRVQKPRIKPLTTQATKKDDERPGGSESERVPLMAPTSYENDNDDEYDSGSESQEHEIHDTASSNSEPVEKLAQSIPTTTKSPLLETTKPTQLPAQPTRKALNTAVIKAFPGLRPKFQQKTITSTTSSTSVSSTSTSSTTGDTQDDLPVMNHNAENRYSTAPIPTFSTTMQPHIPAQRFVPSETIQIRKPSVSFDGPDFDDSKIPVITGVGPVRTISGTGSMIPNSNNAGNVISIKTSTLSPIQTQPHPVIPPPQTSPSLGIGVNNRPPNLIFAEKSDILLKDVERSGDTVLLHWESQKQVAGFRIIYRIFGEDTFRHGPPLATTEREYRIKSIPVDQCIVVCVVPYEDILYNEISPSAGSVPPGSQCKELKPNSPSALMNNMDKITIGASAAICATVILAVFIFILITRRSKNRRPSSGLISKVPPGSMLSQSPGPPALITPGSLSLIKEWDQLSAISARSIPRARVYHGNSIMESTGNISNGHSHGHGTSRSVVLPVQSQRSIPDGHSTHRSYLSAHHAHHNHSMHSYGHNTGHSTTSAAVNNYLNNQSRLLRASLGSRSSQDALNKQLGPSTHVHRHFEQNQKRRRPGVAGRLSQSDSLNTLSGYETPDNWTDHDMDVYVARNATRHDLVQL